MKNWKKNEFWVQIPTQQPQNSREPVFIRIDKLDFLDCDIGSAVSNSWILTWESDSATAIPKTLQYQTSFESSNTLNFDLPYWHHYFEFRTFDFIFGFSDPHFTAIVRVNQKTIDVRHMASTLIKWLMIFFFHSDHLMQKNLDLSWT